MKKVPFTSFLFLLIALVSCSEDDDANNSNQIIPPTSQEYKQLSVTAINDRLQSMQFDAQTGINFTSESGCILNIAANTLELNNAVATGMVDLEFVEIFDRSDMLVTNKPTMGIMSNGNRAVLESGGSFYINVTQNGQSLDLNTNPSLEVPGNLTGGTVDDMTLWNGIIDQNDNLVWEQNDPNTMGQQGIDVGASDYFVLVPGFGWSNVDRFYNDPRPKTTIQVTVPEGYDNTNSAIYLLYNDLPNALAQLDTYDSQTGIFSEHYGQIPIGLNCHVIFVSETNGQYLYAIKNETIEADEVISILESDFNTGTEQQLKDVIENL